MIELVTFLTVSNVMLQIHVLGSNVTKRPHADRHQCIQAVVSFCVIMNNKGLDPTQLEEYVFKAGT